MKYLLFCSIPGLDIEKSLECFKMAAPAGAPRIVGPIKVEPEARAAAEPDLEKWQGVPEKRFTQFLRLPPGTISDAGHKGFEKAFAKARKEAAGDTKAVALIAFHPVLYHQESEAFLQPYDGGRIVSFLQKGEEISRLVSLHDDIYDVYTRLLASRRLFDPMVTQRPNRGAALDIRELLLILQWRDRELATSMALASGIGCRHLLFLNKGRAKALWDILIDEQPVVYFSHPISQVRRDLLNIPHERKCIVPSRDRGLQLQRQCLEIANRLAQSAAIVEPTAIDEFRLDFSALHRLKEDDLREAVLPPLTTRWPIPQDSLLCGPTIPQDVDGLYRVPRNVFGKLEAENTNLEKLEIGMWLLKEEMLRQINVRDHALAEQADLVVAFRPFCQPDSPEMSGGVGEEIDTIFRKIALGKRTCMPGLIIVHPEEDEQRRRTLEFGGVWEKLKSDGRFADNMEGSMQHCYGQCLDLILRVKDDEQQDSVTESILELFQESGIRVSPKTDDSSMDTGGLALEDAAARELAQMIAGQTAILRPQFIEAARKRHSEAIQVLGDGKPHFELTKLVREVLERGVHDGREA